MTKFSLTLAVVTPALALAACSGAEEDTTAVTTEETAPMAEETAMAADTGTVMNANEVTEEQLVAMDGMTPELAATVIAGQPYASVTDFNAALTQTLSQEQANAVLERVFVPVNLNSASEEEIRMIPGMTDKMVHEFEEYRPYADMDVFNREIGKYVDEAEVARLRSYVTL